MTDPSPIGSPEEVKPRAQRALFTLSVFVLLAVVATYFPMIFNSTVARRGSFEFFTQRVAPLGAVHLMLVSFAFIAYGMRAVLVIWTLTVLGLLGSATPTLAGTLVLASLWSLLLSFVGRVVSRLWCERDEQSFGLRLGLGIAVASIAASYLAVVGAFWWWSVLALLGPAIVFTLLADGRTLARDAVAVLRKFCEQRSLATCLMAEAFFLLAIFVAVGASSPEQKSDAIRIYLPYANYLRTFGELPDIPQQWGYVIPQAGLAYAATTSVLFGNVVGRYSMAIALLALVATMVSTPRSPSRTTTAAVVLVMATCPLVLLLSTSLMQDTFVSLTVVLTAVACLRSRLDRPKTSAAVVGALTGLVWVSKFSAAAFALPLLIVAVVRLRRNRFSWFAVVRLGAIAGFSGVLAAAPWLWHSFRASANPIFPFLRSRFPSPLWPDGVGLANLATFRIGDSVKDWIAAPLKLVYRSNQFVEGYDGTLGVVVLFLLLLSAYAIAMRVDEGWSWVVPALVGMILLWRTTAYARYWLPALWLLIPPAATAMSTITVTGIRTLVWALACTVTAAAQIPFAMANSWLDPRGLPWDYFSGATTYRDYLRRRPGFDALMRLREIDGEWPRVWFTGSEAVGHWPVVTMEANVWEFVIHRADEAADIRMWLESAKPDYWIVDIESAAGRAFRAFSLHDDYWRDDLLVASSDTVRIYRFASSERARAAWLRFRQSNPDLTEGGRAADVTSEEAIAVNP